MECSQSSSSAPLPACSGRWQELAAGWDKHAHTHREPATGQGWAMTPLLTAYAGLLPVDLENKPVTVEAGILLADLHRSWRSVAWPCPSESQLLHSWVGQCSQHPLPWLPAPPALASAGHSGSGRFSDFYVGIERNRPG